MPSSGILGDGKGSNESTGSKDGGQDNSESSPDNSGRRSRRSMGIPSKVTVDLVKLSGLSGPEADTMKRYLEMIQVRRQDFNGKVLTVRGEDVVALSCLFQMAVEDMANKLNDAGLIHFT